MRFGLRKALRCKGLRGWCYVGGGVGAVEAEVRGGLSEARRDPVLHTTQLEWLRCNRKGGRW